MKLPILPFLLASVGLMGCGAEPHPSTGMSALVAKVVAEPKTGSPAAPTHVSTYDDLGQSGKGVGSFERVDYSDLGDIVVWLAPSDPGAAVRPPSAPVRVDLNDLGSPSGLSAVACAGQKMIFRNARSRVVDVYSVSDGNVFNLGPISPGGQAEAIAKSEGLIEVVSDAVKDPLARVYVVPGCWAAIAQSGATIAFNDVPPGRYKIATWHPRLPGSSREIELLPDRVTHAVVDVGVNGLPKINAN